MNIYSARISINLQQASGRAVSLVAACRTAFSVTDVKAIAACDFSTERRGRCEARASLSFRP